MEGSNTMKSQKMLIVAGIAATALFLGGCASSNRNAVVFQGGSYKLAGPSGIAIDGAGNVWVTNTKNDSVTELKGVAVPVGGWQNGSQSQDMSAPPARKDGKEKVYSLKPKSGKASSGKGNTTP